jgi:DeoR/GlpR family transcriptional regulator of sugar metabolism
VGKVGETWSIRFFLPGQDAVTSRARPLAAERQREIVRLLNDAGTLRIVELAGRFDVSDETIRRDLATLEEQGLLTRAHGGAVADGVHLETTFQRRMRENRAPKEAIARTAAEMVRDGSTIIIDSGTTMHELACNLRGKRDLVVITNGLNHVEELLANPTLTLVVTGGVVRRATLGGAGELAVATLQSLRADHTFIATHGFSGEAGLTYPSFEEVAVKRAMIAAGEEVTLLADGTKCGRASMVRVAPLDQVNRIITSPPIPSTERERIEQLGIELLVVGDGEPASTDGNRRLAG